MNLQELAGVVPVHIHRGRRYFVRIVKITDPLRSQFTEALRGSHTPQLGNLQFQMLDLGGAGIRPN